MENSNNLKQQIKMAVEENKPDLALKLLSELYGKHSSINLVIQLKAQYKKLKDDSLSGIVSRQEGNTETNIITKKVLDLVDRYEVEDMLSSSDAIPNRNIKITQEYKKETEMINEVFVTYSWDSEEHKDKVISFCDFLRKKGFHATMDRKISQEQTAPNFTKMMHQAMTDYQKVIVILTEKYKEKADSFSGGVGMEYNLIINDIDSNPKKYLLVSFNGISDKILPMAFKGCEIIDISTQEKQKTLFAKLQDEVEIEFSPVAPNKPQVTKKEIPDFNETQNKSIELIDVFGDGCFSSKSGGKYNFVQYSSLILTVKNNSKNTVNGFAIELTLPRALTISALEEEKALKISLMRRQFFVMILIKNSSETMKNRLKLVGFAL